MGERKTYRIGIDVGGTFTKAVLIDNAGFEVSIARSAASEPITGRLLVVISTRETPEPRFAIGLTGPVMLGRDIEQLSPGSVAKVDASYDSYPL